ncbi:hypothetical protein [Pseudoxanthomonas sp. GM95]|uniref:hypothetical protein n=1 Tax=Pseudoxanthomonas sp. GM95 TaxID=1881043 RepID=UPI0020C91933|nr:hypothetical protein [Pseudoxanthomonas sp. GM95]
MQFGVGHPPFRPLDRYIMRMPGGDPLKVRVDRLRSRRKHRGVVPGPHEAPMIGQVHGLYRFEVHGKRQALQNLYQPIGQQRGHALIDEGRQEANL